MNEEVRDLIQAAGALAEVAKISYDSFRTSGFTSSQALTLTQTVLCTQMQIAATHPSQDGAEG